MRTLNIDAIADKFPLMGYKLESEDFKNLRLCDLIGDLNSKHVRTSSLHCDYGNVQSSWGR